MAEVTSKVVKEHLPGVSGEVELVLTYTKGAAGDTVTLPSNVGSVLYVDARTGTGGVTSDPATVSGNVVTLSSGTGPGIMRVLVRLKTV